MCTREDSPCQQDDGDPQGGKGIRYLTPDLPEDIWFHVHCLMPMRDAARAACLSRAFLHSWRCRPNLILRSDTIGSYETEIGWDFSRKIDRILSKHSGVGLKIIKVDYMCIDEFNELMPGVILIVGYLLLSNQPKCLTILLLHDVSIMGDELELFLSNSLALEQLDLANCKEIVCLKIPCILQQLRSLHVFECSSLKVIESKARNLSSFYFRGDGGVKLSLRSTLQMKNLNLHRANFVHYARTELPSTMPNLEAIHIGLGHEVVNTPMLPTKFLYLKHLTIRLIGYPFSPSYNYFSLVSFLNASPSLETLIMDVTQQRMEHESVFANPDLRHISEHRHGHLKNVNVTGFNSVKGLVELACYILKNAVSLECLTLDTIYGDLRCYLKTSRRCYHMSEGILVEARRAVVAIRTYIEHKVPSTVKFTVLEPCSRCHV